MDLNQDNQTPEPRAKWPRSAKLTVWGLAALALVLFAAVDTNNPKALSAQETQEAIQSAREGAREEVEAETEGAIADAEGEAYSKGYDDGKEHGRETGKGEAAQDYATGYATGFKDGKRASGTNSSGSDDDFFEKVFWKTWRGMSSDEKETVCFGIENMPNESINAFSEPFEEGGEFTVDRDQALALFREACNL